VGSDSGGRTCRKEGTGGFRSEKDIIHSMEGLERKSLCMARWEDRAGEGFSIADPGPKIKREGACRQRKDDRGIEQGKRHTACKNLRTEFEQYRLEAGKEREGEGQCPSIEPNCQRRSIARKGGVTREGMGGGKLIESAAGPGSGISIFRCTEKKGRVGRKALAPTAR